MQRKTNRLLLLLIGTALAACTSTSQQGSSGIETEAEVTPSEVYPPESSFEPKPEEVQYSEAELDVSDLGPVDYADESVTYAEEDVGSADSGISEAEAIPEEQLEFPVTTYEMPADETVDDLGAVDQSSETLSYAEENLGGTGTGVSAADQYEMQDEVEDLGAVDHSGETLSYAEENLGGTGTSVGAAEEYEMADEVDDLGPVDTSNETLSFNEEPVYQEESVGDVTTYQSVTVNAEARPLFAFDKSDVRSDEEYKLKNFVSELSGAEYQSVWVVGHADRIGSVEYNQKLSEKRAGAVKAFLVRLGVVGDKINMSGRSELMPVTTEAECSGLRGKALIECYQPDRRVEVSVSAEVVKETTN